MECAAGMYAAVPAPGGYQPPVGTEYTDGSACKRDIEDAVPYVKTASNGCRAGTVLSRV